MVQYSLRQLALIIGADVICVVFALYLASLLRTYVDIGLEGPVSSFDTPPLLYWGASLVWVFALAVAQVYILRRNLNLSQKITSLVIGHMGASLLFWGLLYIGFRNYSRLQSLYVIGLSFIFFFGIRLVAHKIATRSAQKNNQASRILIVGRDKTAIRLAEAINSGQSSQLKFVGYVDFSADSGDLSDHHIDSLGTLENLSNIIRENRVTDLIISLKWFDQQSVDLIARILSDVENSNVDVRVAPDYSDVAYFQASSDMFADIPLISIREPILNPPERIIKRLVDVVFSMTALILCMPVFVVIALAIRLDSPGPIVLHQERIGYRGSKFLMYKFRSMFHSEAGTTPPGNPYNLRKLKEDPRITRVGRFLRRTSLDELPQFLNVLKGEMSIVGPRPEVPWMVEHYEWWQRKRFEVPQGMTGWWQVNGRADKPMYYHTNDDLYYIQNYSLWLDLRIILRTVIAVIVGRGAY
jgi:exopolysaccharide biosynthesis polyprenyl glycosylphosphotransferase